MRFQNGIDSISKVIDTKKVVGGLIEGSTEEELVLSWCAYYYFFPESKQIIKISFTNPSTTINYYYSQEKLVKIIENDSIYYLNEAELFNSKGMMTDTLTKYRTLDLQKVIKGYFDSFQEKNCLQRR